MTKPIATNDIAISAGGDDVGRQVPFGVIKTVASKVFACPAIHACLCKNVVEYERVCDVARKPFRFVDLSVSGRKKNGATFIGLSISLLAGLHFFAPVCCQVRPSLGTSIAPRLPARQALLAFVGKAKRASGVLVKKLARGREMLVASKAFSGIHDELYHTRYYGPHWQLPYGTYK